jgi:hypothetical protein
MSSRNSSAWRQRRDRAVALHAHGPRSRRVVVGIKLRRAEESALRLAHDAGDDALE